MTAVTDLWPQSLDRKSRGKGGPREGTNSGDAPALHSDVSGVILKRYNMSNLKKSDGLRGVSRDILNGSALYGTVEEYC